MVEAMFFKAYYAYLKGNLKEAEIYYSILKEEFRNKGDPFALSPSQLQKIKKVFIALKTGSMGTTTWLEEDVPEVVEKEKPGIRQNELVKRLHHEAFEDLKKCIGSQSLYLYNIEHPCGDYGKVDMVYYDDHVAYPIEVKRHEGKHDLIGQIGKYAMHFNLCLHNKHYDDVVPVTLCRTYNTQTLKKLKMMEVLTLRYYFSEDKIKISNI